MPDCLDPRSGAPAPTPPAPPAPPQEPEPTEDDRGPGLGGGGG